MSILAVVIEGAIGWAVGRIGDTGGKWLKDRLGDKASMNELSDIIARAIDKAVESETSLAEDFRSEIFLQNILAPMILSFMLEPTLTLDENDISEKFIAKFVTPFGRRRKTDDVLRKLFSIQKSDLDRTFRIFLSALRAEFYASKYWKEEIRDKAVEDIRSTVFRLERHLIPLQDDGTVDLNIARRDAEVGSASLRAWTKDIGGQQIERPELQIILQRIREKPFGATLVIGEAGAGKSALFAELVSRLEEQGMVVFAIKADLLPAEVRTLADISTALGLKGQLLPEIEALSRDAPVVVLIDQLDAVSEVMDRSSERMRLLLQLASHFQKEKRSISAAPPVHILVSSRKFEADYDARFQSLEAETVQLSLPSHEQLEKFLNRLGIALSDVPAALHETLRRPFALRLFYDIQRRGVPVKELIASELLSTWLVSADLGDAESRKQALAFLEELAADMTDTETLWRPADHYEIRNPTAVRMTMACGIISRLNGQLGFSHQAWLDDFQAKSFSTAQALSEFAWERQEGLFARATILRSLQRLRVFDGRAYAGAIDSLLGEPKTRRHLRHLIVDLVSGQKEPQEREQAWVKRLMATDLALAQRALARTTNQWEHWRGALRPLTKQILGDKKLRWHAVQLLVAETRFDPEFVNELIRNCWGTEDRDIDAFEVLSRSAQWSADSIARVQTVFERQKLNNFAVVDYAKHLGDHRAAELFEIYLNKLDYKNEDQLQFHGLSELVEKNSSAFANVLLVWFVQLASREHDGAIGMRNNYPKSRSLPYFWNEERFGEGIFSTVAMSLARYAQSSPHELLQVVSAFFSVDIDEVQSVIADALGANGATLAGPAADFLLADDRRLNLGMVYANDTDNVGHLVQGWSSQQLLSAIVPHLDTKRLEQIRDRIEAWDPYKDEASVDDDARTKFLRLAWAESNRLPLLEKIPRHLLTPRRFRQITEWRTTQPVLKAGGARVMASFVTSPMSADQMSKATDDELFRMLDEQSGPENRWPHGRRGFREGGPIEIARAFAEFGKQHPDRALRIAETRFHASRHEHSAGELVRVLAENQYPDLTRLLVLIRSLSANGLTGQEWRRDAAWALQSLANHHQGLPDEDIQTLESWIVDDIVTARERIARRLELAEMNRSRNNNQRSQPAALVFGRHRDGMRFLPQDNFTLLSAMAAGWLRRPTPDRNAWLCALERHVQRSEDPAIWGAILVIHGRSLYGADRPRVVQLLQDIWGIFPDALGEQGIADFLWDFREVISVPMWKAVLSQWLASDAPKSRQAAGELTAAEFLVSERKEVSEALTSILTGPTSPERLGVIYAASAAWGEGRGEMRDRGYELWSQLAEQASGDEAQAAAAIIHTHETLIPDDLTQKMLLMASENPHILRACLGRDFAEQLQRLLLNPGFEELVLTLSKRCADLKSEDSDLSIRWPQGDSFVSIAIALQRASGSLRTRAMDLYEQLLDGSAYGAEEAAEASLIRVA